MTGLASRFFATALIYAVLGMTLGLIMGMSQDHSQLPTHAHLMLIGWVSFAIYGFFYHAFPGAAATRRAHMHFWLTQASLVVLIIGLFLIYGGFSTAEPIAAAGSVGLLASAVLFAIIAWPAVRGAV